MEGKCKECVFEGKLANTHFKLCKDCNNIRLHGSKFGKQYKKPIKKRKSRTASQIKARKEKKEKVLTKIIKDERFYKECFESCSDHSCEECGTELPTTFMDGEGKVKARWRYSHIVAKSIAPWLRHIMKNINHLCRECHTKWDHGDKKSMKIYKLNKIKYPKYHK